MKTYADHVFIVADAISGHGIQVFDLTQLRTVTNPPVTFTKTAHYTQFGPSHNIAIDTVSGFAYAVDTNTCSGNLHMVDITNPTNPTFAGCGPTNGTVHDAQCVVYTGPDTEHQGKQVCFNSNVSSDTLNIVDVTDKANPVTLSITGYTGAVTTHQSWLTEDHRFVLLGDESDENAFGINTTTFVFDVSDLDAPVVTGTHTHGTTAIDHNLYVKGGFTYQANYRAGLRILSNDDLSTATLTEVAFFDTYPGGSGTGFQGAWNVYPFYDSCVIAVNDIESGLFVLRAPALCSCGDGVLDPGEECDGADLGGATCSGQGCTGGTLGCTAGCKLDFSQCTSCPQCNFNAVCDLGEDCTSCPSDCVSGTAGASCGNGICEAGDGENCLTCASDCNGRQGGNPNNRYCCGDGVAGEGAVTCADSRCGGTSACTNDPVVPASFCCGDTFCDNGEDATNCAVDCGGGPGGCTLGQVGDPCTDGSQCCSGNCKGKAGQKTCK
jgi:choice-of-anchor B domain-containing protein